MLSTKKGQHTRSSLVHRKDNCKDIPGGVLWERKIVEVVSEDGRDKSTRMGMLINASEQWIISISVSVYVDDSKMAV